MAQLESQWIAGFVDGEGCFYVGAIKNSSLTNGYQIQPEFTVVQHERDIQILYDLKENFQCGLVARNHDTRYHWRVRKLDHLIDIVIPFFEKHQLRTKRGIEFQRFRKICLKMKEGVHLTPDGFKEVSLLAKNIRVQ